MRLILADDSALLRTSLARALDNEFEVVGEAGDAEQLLCLVDEQRPDVVVVDIRMPPNYSDEGLRAAHQIRSRDPTVGVLVLSHHLQTAYAVSLISGGPEGMGYLLKDRVSDLRELEDALRRLAAGETVIDPEIVARLIARNRERSTLEDLNRTRARRAPPNGRRPLERSHLEDPLPLGTYRRDARVEHLRQTRTPHKPLGPPTRPRSARLSARMTARRPDISRSRLRGIRYFKCTRIRQISCVVPTAPHERAAEFNTTSSSLQLNSTSRMRVGFVVEYRAARGTC